MGNDKAVMTRVDVLGTESEFLNCTAMLHVIKRESANGRHPKLHAAAETILEMLDCGGFYPESETQLHFIVPDGESSSPSSAKTEEYDLGKNEGL